MSHSEFSVEKSAHPSRDQINAWAAVTVKGRAAAAAVVALSGAALRTPAARLLARQVAAGLRAEAEWVAAFDQLATSRASRHLGRGIPEEDLNQEARLKLVLLTRGFNAERGFTFSTYAVPGLDGYLQDRIMAVGRAIRIPVEQLTELAHLARGRADLDARLGRPATHRELALALGVDMEKVALWESWSAPATALTEGMEATLTGGAEPMEDAVDAALDEESEWGQLLAVLPAGSRERSVMELRMGALGDMPMRQADVAAELGISQASVSVSEHRAVAAIKAAQAA